MTALYPPLKGAVLGYCGTEPSYWSAASSLQCQPHVFFPHCISDRQIHASPSVFLCFLPGSLLAGTEASTSITSSAVQTRGPAYPPTQPCLRCKDLFQCALTNYLFQHTSSTFDICLINRYITDEAASSMVLHCVGKLLLLPYCLSAFPTKA